MAMSDHEYRRHCPCPECRDWRFIDLDADVEDAIWFLIKGIAFVGLFVGLLIAAKYAALLLTGVWDGR